MHKPKLEASNWGKGKEKAKAEKEVIKMVTELLYKLTPRPPR